MKAHTATRATTTGAAAAAAAAGQAGARSRLLAGIAAAALAAALAAAALPGAGAVAPGEEMPPLEGIAAAGVLEDPCDPAAGAHAGGEPAEAAAAEPNPKLEAEMNARLDALHGEIEGIMSEYGFPYSDPHLTDEQLDEMHGRLNEVYAGYDQMLDEAFDLAMQGRDGGFPPQAVLAAIDMLLEEEQYEIMREYGHVIREPALSAEDEAAMNERIEAVWKKIDAVIDEYSAVQAGHSEPGEGDGCGPAYSADDEMALIGPLFDEIDAIMAEYGFVSEMPDMNRTEERLFNARMDEIWARHAGAIDDLARRLAPMLANGSISMAEALEEDRRLSERGEKEYSEAMAEYGFVFVVPELSAEDEEAMNERLERVYEKIDAAYAQLEAPHGGGETHGGGAAGGQ